MRLFPELISAHKKGQRRLLRGCLPRKKEENNSRRRLGVKSAKRLPLHSTLSFLACLCLSLFIINQHTNNQTIISRCQRLPPVGTVSWLHSLFRPSTRTTHPVWALLRFCLRGSQRTKSASRLVANAPKNFWFSIHEGSIKILLYRATPRERSLKLTTTLINPDAGTRLQPQPRYEPVNSYVVYSIQ